MIMPYLFGLLVLANVAAFGYFWLQPDNKNTQGFENAKAQVQKPIKYQNNSANLPPLIGQK